MHTHTHTHTRARINSNVVMRGEENEEENEMAKRRKRNDDDDLQITCAPEEEEEEEEEELLKRGRPLAWGVAKTRTPFREVRFEEGRQYECRIPSLLAAFEQIEQKLKNEKPISTDPKTFDPDTILKIDEDCSEKAISLGYKLGTIKHSAYALLAMAGPGGMKAANIVSIAKRLDLYNPGTCKTPNGSEGEFCKSVNKEHGKAAFLAPAHHLQPAPRKRGYCAGLRKVLKEDASPKASRCKASSDRHSLRCFVAGGGPACVSCPPRRRGRCSGSGKSRVGAAGGRTAGSRPSAASRTPASPSAASSHRSAYASGRRLHQSRGQRLEYT